jgi:hypothetical protein
MMDANLELFLILLKDAITEAERVQRELLGSSAKQSLLDSSDRTVRNLRSLLKNVEAGRLPLISDGQIPPESTLGLAKHIGEWSDDDRLLRVVREVDRQFRKL